MRIRAKAILSLIIPFFIIIFSIGAVISFLVGQTIEEEVFNRLEEMTQSRAYHTETVLEMYGQRAKLLTSKTWLKRHLKSYYESSDEEYKIKVEEILADTQKANPKFLHISIANPEGQIIISTYKDLVGQNVSDKDFFINGKEDYFISDLLEEDLLGVRLYISGPLILDGEFLGVITIGSDGKSLEKIMTNHTGLGETGEAYLVNKDGYMITPSRLLKDTFLKQRVDTENFRHCISMIQHPETKGHMGHKSVAVLKDYRGVEIIGTHIYIPEMQWCLLAEIDRAEALQTRNNLLWFLGLTYFIAIVLLIVVVVIMSKRIVKPIKALHEGTEIIEKGNLDYKVGTKAKDEIGQLSRSFDKMTLAIKKSRAEIDSRVKGQTEEIIQKAKDLANQQKAVLNILEDVEEEKDKVAREKDKIDAILHSIGDGVFVVNKDLEITMYNEIAAQISYVSVAEAMGRRYDKVLKFVYEENDKKINDKFIREAIDSGHSQEMSNHTILIRKDGQKVPVADSAAPIKDKEGLVVGCVVVFRDVTKEREIDKAKTEFVSLASHQLRTPLSTINWYAEMLMAGDAGKMTKDQNKYLKEIYQGNQRMVELVNALLNVSRIELGTMAVEPKPTDLKELIESLFKEIEHDIKKKKLIVSKSYDSGLPKANVDPKLMRIVFQNLLTNAIKYTPEKGKINLEISLQKAGANANIEGIIEEDSLLIKISDNGYGIPKRQQSKIFTKLFRADNVREKDTEGTGLGLYIVKSIIEHAKGKIWFESAENKGTVFYIVMPLTGMEAKRGTKSLA